MLDGEPVAETASTQVLRRLTDGMASSDEIATLSGKVAFEWIAKTWEERQVNKRFWLAPIVEACHSSEQGRSNICLYLLPALFKARPTAIRELLEASGFDLAVADHGQVGWTEDALETAIAWLNVANQLGTIELDNPDLSSQTPSKPKVHIPTSLISLCLTHASASIRCAAFSLLVLSAVPFAPLPRATFSLLRLFYVHGLGEEDPEFRQQILALSGKLLLRLRESVWKARKLADGSAYVARVQAFLGGWAHDLLDGLNPAKPFRVKMNALRLFDILLQAQLDPAFAVETQQAAGYSSYRKTAATPMPSFSQKYRRQEEGKPTPSRAEKSRQVQAGEPLLSAWPFQLELVTADSAAVLLRLLQSTYTALRHLAIGMLEKYPSPLPGYDGEDGEDRAERELLVPALRMVRSGREAEASAGAGVIALVWRKCVLEGGAHWDLAEIGGWSRPSNRRARRGARELATATLPLRLTC